MKKRLLVACGLIFGLAPSGFSGIIVGSGGAAKSVEESTLQEIAISAMGVELIEIEGKKFKPGFVDLDNKRIILHAEDGSEDLLLYSGANENQDHLVEHGQQ